MSKDNKLPFLKNWNTIEQITYWMVWLILWLIPLVFWNFGEHWEKMRIVGGWVRIMPFFIVFMIHNLILLPGFLLRKKYLLYLLLTLSLIILVNYWFIFSKGLHQIIVGFFDADRIHAPQAMDPLREHHQGRGPHRYNDIRGVLDPRFRKGRYSVYLLYTYNVLTSIMIVGFNTAFRFASQWLIQERDREEIEKEAARSQLNALQNQVSPHFFMNTLNNIHALIDYSTDDAKDAVLRLSKMMRYLLYESDQGRTSLKKEVEFLQSYIDLMKLRLQPEVDLKVDLPKETPDVGIYSLLSISFLENAFKYGIDPRAHSFIHILMEINMDMVHINVRNSLHAKGSSDNLSGGIGIENAKKRLELLFGDSYTLNIYRREQEFEVDLIYPIL